MIRKVKFDTAKLLPLAWMKDLKIPAELTFKPGLNVIIGPNGCGKSTILKTIGMMLHATQGGVSTVTDNSVQELFVRDSDRSTKFVNGVEIEHDGQPIAFCDHTDVGLFGGMAAFDFDFMDEGVFNATTGNKISAGQKTVHKVNTTLTKIAKAKNITYKNHRESERAKEAERFLKPNIDLGPTTVIFDEPERALDALNNITLWKCYLLRTELYKRLQFIVATHSPVAFQLSKRRADINFIEMENNYLKNTIKNLKELGIGPANA